MAALRKDEGRISPIQKVGKAEFSRFVEACKTPRQPSEALRASVAAAMRKR